MIFHKNGICDGCLKIIMQIPLLFAKQSMFRRELNQVAGISTVLENSGAEQRPLYPFKNSVKYYQRYLKADVLQASEKLG